MASAACCPFCSAAWDDWRHSLLDCTLTRCVWALVDEELTQHITINICESAKDWIFFLIETLSHSKFVTVTITFWAVWTARRKAIHEEIFQSPFSVYGFVMSYLSDLDVAYTCPPRLVCPTPPAATICTAPPSFHVKINVDATVSKLDDRCVVIAICRDETSVFIEVSVLVVPEIDDPATLEAIERLSLVSDLNVHRLHLVSDCLKVVKTIRENDRPSYYSILYEIRQREDNFKMVSFVHERRSANVHAHVLA